MLVLPAAEMILDGSQYSKKQDKSTTQNKEDRIWPFNAKETRLTITLTQDLKESPGLQGLPERIRARAI